MEGATGFNRSVLRLLERLTISLSTDVITVSHSLAHALREESLIKPGRELHIIGAGSSNGVNVTAVRNASTPTETRQLREELDIADKIVIGYLGRIHPDKGIDVLSRSLSSLEMRKHTNCAVLCVGSVENERSLERLRETPMHITYVDHTSEPWKYLAAMDILCLPTRREGFPNVVLEASALGIPTVTTDATGAVDSVIDGVTGKIVPVDDSGSLSSALSELVESSTLRKEMGRAAHMRAERDFRQETIWRGLDALYTNVK